MLPQDPPPWFVRSMAWLLIAMFGVALLAAIFVKLPETVTCPFLLVPAGGADPIQSPRLAIVYRVCVRVEGRRSRCTIHSTCCARTRSAIGARSCARWARDLRTREQGLTRDDAVFASQSEIKTAEISQAESEVKFREKHAESSRDLLERMEKLTKTGGISLVEVIQYRLQAAGSEKDLSVAQRTLQQVKLERQQMETEHSRQRAENVAEVEKLKMRLSALRDDLQNSQQNLLTVRAPYAGVVISQTQQNAGSVVQNGEELCQLAPNDAKARVRLTLGEARAEAGQRAAGSPLLRRLSLSTLRRGRRKARLGQPLRCHDHAGQHFVALASLDQSELTKRASPPAARWDGRRGADRHRETHDD